jgi:pimeloyl-ACP methyl ester carboxylesterase
VPPRISRHRPHLAFPAPGTGLCRLSRRGYAPSALPADGGYQIAHLARDAGALHDALGGRDDAVIIGHDWGALAAYAAVAHRPERWRRAVTLAVPPTASIGMSLFTYAQLRRSWYMFFFLSPLAELALPLDDYAFIDGLWADWSPGYDGSWDVARVKESIGDPAHMVAAIGYYRALYNAELQVPELADEQNASLLATPKPTLYLHGRDDGCMLLSSIGSPLDFMAEGSEMEIVDGAGHFLHVEQPDVVNRRMVEFLTR